jgi:hypothetical protein
MKPIVLIGRADYWKEDLKELQKLINDFDVMAVGLDCLYSGVIKYFVTYHPTDIVEYLKRRSFAETNTNFRIIGHKSNPGVDIIELHREPSGSSALLGSFAAIKLGYNKIILCGCPMEGRHPNNFQSYNHFQKGWIAYKSEVEGKVKSMSGWTKEFLGAPTEEWLED